MKHPCSCERKHDSNKIANMGVASFLKNYFFYDENFS